MNLEEKMGHIGRKIMGIAAVGLAAVVCSCGERAQPTDNATDKKIELRNPEEIHTEHITGTVVDLKSEERLLLKGPSTEANYDIILLTVKSDNKTYNLVSGKYELGIKKGDKVDIDYIVDNEITSVDILNRDGGFEINPDQPQSLEGVIPFSYRADGQIHEYKVINKEK